MSSIPPNPIASVVQSPLAQREQARSIDAEAGARADAARKSAGSPDVILEVESTDADTRVHPDAGGGGSQGRYDAEPEQPAPGEDENGPGVTLDEAGQPHIDLSA